MDIKEVFEKQIKIEPKVMAIETLFNNARRLEKTDFDPPYQRNYVWDSEKATYFIESILLGTEIPPLIFFKGQERIEVIDGRQRYQTILRFINDEFKLSKTGLNKLTNLGNKFFRNLSDLKDLFWDTKLRIIEFSFHNLEDVDQRLEDKVKIEIFKRYNSGITPLKGTEIDKAIYLENDLNSYFKEKIRKDKIIFDKISDIFSFERPNIEILLKKIRILFVLHKMPIRRYAIKKDKAINKFYEFYSSSLSEEEIERIFNDFIKKINLLSSIKKEFESKKYDSNRLQYECVFWALQILEVEGINLKEINKSRIKNLVDYIEENRESYSLRRSSFAKELITRYKTTATFFEKEFQIVFKEYLAITDEFTDLDKEITKEVSSDEIPHSFESLRINKPEPSSITIEDISRQMKRQRFLIRPPYQRSEVINKRKSSAIIESIFLGIKIPPIFIFKRIDGVSEVLDGQQRLLSIIGFIEEKYLDEENNLEESEKSGYSLSLKNGILKELHGKKFKNLESSLQDKILEYDLWIIEIDQKYNADFDPVDLFIRLNYKPYPIKENTFEMWNSYIDRKLVDNIKDVYSIEGNWFYFRKNNKRMPNESILTGLSYLEFKFINTRKEESKITDYLDFYKIGDKINFRIKSKVDITKNLEDETNKENFLIGINSLKDDFILKVKTLCSPKSKASINELNNGLDDLFGIDRRRTQQGFYALWYFLTYISIRSVSQFKNEIRHDIKNLFASMQNIDEKSDFVNSVKTFWIKYEK